MIVKIIKRKYLTVFGACAALALMAPLAANADNISISTSGSFSNNSGTASWTYSGVGGPVNVPQNHLAWGQFTYNSGDSNVVDFDLTVTPTIGGAPEPLVFTGTIVEDSFNNAYLSFSNGPLTAGAYSFSIDTTGWLTTCGVDPCVQLNNGNVDKLTSLYGNVTTASAVPEPASAGMMLLAAFGLLAFGWKRKLFASKQ